MRRSMLCAVAVGVSACSASPPHLDAEHASAVRDSVSEYVAGVAHRVSTGGPTAWLTEFVNDSTFFMVADGHMAFPDYTSMSRFLPGFARATPSIALDLSTVRVDPLAPGLALFGANYHETLTDSTGHRMLDSGYVTAVAIHSPLGWRLRDAHWSHPDPVIAPHK